jgi:hypothetical protein
MMTYGLRYVQGLEATFLEVASWETAAACQSQPSRQKPQ